MTSTNRDNLKNKKRRSIVRITIVVSLFALIGFFLWQYVKGSVTSNLESQLSALKIGKPTIGDVSIGSSGIKAKDIEFFREGETDPWLTVDRMSVNHPLRELISGVEQFNELEFENVAATIDASQFAADDENDAREFWDRLDLSQIKIPAATLKLKNADLQIQVEGKPDIAIRDVDLAIQRQDKSNDGSAYNVEGAIGDLAGGSWKVRGALNSKTDSFDLAINSDNVSLSTKQWQAWPLIPEGMEKNIRVDGNVSLELNVRQNETDDLEVAGTGKVKRLELVLPTFDLPISIRNGDIRVDKKKVVLEGLLATIDGNDKLTGRIETSLDAFPIKTTFETQFEDLTITSLRKLVVEIPDQLAANSSGNASGSVLVERSTRTTIDVNAKGTSSNGIYGEIDAEKLTANVEILDLIFDDQQQFESMGGHVDVNADMVDEPIADILKTFELESLQSQMDFVGEGDGKLKMRLPLATVDDMKTWTLNVLADVAKGSISGQPIENAHSIVDMTDGFLLLKNTADTHLADPIDKDAVRREKLEVSLRWPLVADVENAETAQVIVKGSGIPTKWVNGFFQRQIEVAFEKSNPEYVTEELSRLGGAVSFSVNIDMPAAQPEEIALWNLTGDIRDSLVKVEEHKLSNVNGNVRMRDGQLKFEKIAGEFENGGSLSGLIHVDLRDNTNHSFDLNANQVPAQWLATVIHDTFPDVKAALESADLDSLIEPGQLAGIINAAVKFENDVENAVGFRFGINARSDEIKIAETSLRDLQVVGNVAGNDIQIKQITGKIDKNGSLNISGEWSLKDQSGTGEFGWNKIPIGWLSKITDTLPPGLSGTTNGKLTVSKPEPSDKAAPPFAIDGQVGLKDLVFQRLKAKDIGFDLVTRDGFVLLENFRNANQELGFDAGGKIGLQAPFPFDVTGKLDKIRLSQIFERTSLVDTAQKSADVTGIAIGDFNVKGQFENFDWRTSGKIDLLRPTYDRKKFTDASIDWDHLGNDWKKSKLVINAFGGVIKMVELSSVPERVRMEIENVNAEELTLVLAMPVKFTGRLSGEASLNDWSLLETRWADMKVKGSSVLVGPTEFGDFQMKADYRNNLLVYDLDGTMLDGRLTGEGKAKIDEKKLAQTKFPIQLKLAGASLNGLYRGSNYFRSLRQLSGRLSAIADLVIGVDSFTTGGGRVRVGQVKWDRELLTRDASVRLRLVDSRIVFDDLRADLKRGSITAKAVVPLGTNARGSYEAIVRDLDLDRLTEIFGDSVKAKGLLEGRISGQIGRTITGQGFVGVHRATVNGVSGQSLRLPIQFRASPLDGSGKVELRRSTFRVFDGNASGEAQISFGNVLNVDVDIKFSNVDTEKLLSTVADIDKADQGKLTGRFQLKGRSIRSTRDLNGSFRGTLQRASAFKLPILSDVARVIAGGNIQSGDYNSDEIVLRLDDNRVNVQQFNFSNSFVKIAITGDAYLDGRLNLAAAARVDQLRQPSLLDDLAGSPLARLNGSPVAFFAQAAEFLSERVVFLKIGGTFDRPQVRIDSSQQLREETIRYFLRGSQILPYGTRPNN